VTSCLGGGPTPPLSASHAQHSAVSSRHVGLMPFPAAFMKAQSDSRVGPQPSFPAQVRPVDAQYRRC
jgi:hypothetical protein